MEYATIEGIELVTAGMDWPASTGPTTFTLEHLADAVTAANDDPHIVTPRVKLGHYSDVNGSLAVVSPFAAIGDAAPVFGRWINLRLENDGAVIVADAVEMPAWLAETARSSFPSRSIEGDWDVVTPGGKRYSFVLTACVLLGEHFPAVQDLDDLELLLSEGPDALAAARSAGLTATRLQEPSTVPSTAASVSVDTIWQRFTAWCRSEPIDGLDTYWWWPRDIRVDPDEVIADDDDGNLWRVSFTTDGADAITFEPAVRVRETFVDVGQAVAATRGIERFHPVFVEQDSTPAGVATSVAQRHGQQVLASYERPDRSDRTINSRTAAATQEEGLVPDVDLALQRRRLNLPDDTPDEQVIEALNAETGETTEPAAPAETTETAVEEAPIAATASDRVATVDRDRLDRLERDAAAGAQARREQVTASLDAQIDAAVRDGRITPASRESWRAAIDPGNNPDTVAASRAESEQQALAALEPGRVPVTERGTAAASTDGQITQTGWFPQLASKES